MKDQTKLLATRTGIAPFYPPYIELSQDSEGSVSISIRSLDMNYASIILTKDVAKNLLEEALKKLAE